MSNTAAYIARRKPLFTIDNITSQDSLHVTDPDCAPESATSVATSGTGSHAHDGVVTLMGPSSAIASLVLLLFLISRILPNELRVPTNA